MKRSFRTFLSYLFTAMLASVVTLAILMHVSAPFSKLNQIEALIQNRFIGEIDTAAMEDAAAEAMVHALGDRWSTYLSAEENALYREQVENSYVGIGVTITAEPESKGFRILSVQSGGSAAEAGLIADDVIVSAEGQSAADMTLNELSAVIRGEAGTIVNLEILRGEDILQFAIPRAHITIEVVTSRMLEDRIGVITIANFNSRCADEAIAAIEALLDQGAEALIFDVRNNPGGYVTELVKLLDYLLPEGVLFRSLDYAGNESIEHSDAACLEMPIAVICNEDSYSAAEFFPAAIQEYGAGVVVGAPTCGKGYFQYDYELTDGSAVKLSVGKYFTPNGSSLIGTGIQPDIPVEVTPEDYLRIASGSMEPENDSQLQAALEHLRSMIPTAD